MEARDVEVFRNCKWDAINFEDLKKGESFRMFEKDGETVFDLSGNTVFYSISEPYKNNEGIWAIDIA